MDWRVLALLGAVPLIAGHGIAAPPMGADAGAAGAAAPHGVHSIRADFPFPVLPGWTEQSTTQAHGPPRQVLSSVWLHGSDAASQAIAYRHLLEAAGYRIAPGRLAGNTEIALTGTGMVAGRWYRFTVDFSRGAGGDQSVALGFTPCGMAC